MGELFTALAALSLLVWVSVFLRPSRPYLPLWEEEARGEASGDHAAVDQPLLSIIIPARNEEATVGEVLASHFRSDYPRKEIILVDDASTDGTRRIAEEVGRRAPCAFTVLSLRHLPEGWSGKVHALWRGTSVARGTYLLFTDADIVWDPTLLSSLVGESEAKGLDLNSRMVLLPTQSFAERMFVPAFLFFFSLLYPFRAAARPRGPAAAAGGCMLVRRSALKRAGGLGKIRQAIIDDIALARLIRRSGGTLRLSLTRRARSCRRYLRIRDFWATVTRTAFTELRYSFLRLGVATAALLLAFCVPVAALLLGGLTGDTLGAAFGGGALALSLCAYLPAVWSFAVPVAYSAALPLVGLLYLAMTWHSAFLYLRGRRSCWKGRTYAPREAPER